jgi:hypothetical protein
MADTKISALTASTTPLAGTEVLPIVQSGTTKQVSVANLTAGRAVNVSSLTASGNIQGDTVNFGTSYGQLTWDTGVAIIQAAAGKDVVIRTQGSSTNRLAVGTTDVTVGTGNLVIGTSGKGIDFSATPGTGTSELLADYEEGTWTPIYLPETNSFTSITYNIQTGSYTKIGRVVYFSFSLRTASLTIGTATDGLRISGLPFTVGGASQSTSLVGQSETWGGDYPSGAFARGGTQLVSMLYRTTANGGTLPIQVSDMSTSASANEISGGGFYIV